MKFNYTAHKKLWNWLAENTDKSKHDWPEWKENGGKYEPSLSDCFACDYAEDRAGEECLDSDLICLLCPLKEWREDAENQFVANDDLSCDPCMRSYYNQWRKADEKERKEFAEKIRDLEVAEGVEYE